eukprot:481249-Rhodomonas_salina.1
MMIHFNTTCLAAPRWWRDMIYREVYQRLGKYRSDRRRVCRYGPKEQDFYRPLPCHNDSYHQAGLSEFTGVNDGRKCYIKFLETGIRLDFEYLAEGSHGSLPGGVVISGKFHDENMSNMLYHIIAAK